jgi:integrase
MFRLGGRESSPRYGGSFRTMREARIRRDWVAGELAAMRVPDPRRLAALEEVPTLAEAAADWQASRVDVSAATATYHRSALARARPLLNRRVDQITSADIAALVAALVEAGKARETVRKTVTVLAMIFDFADVAPNPARDRVRVKLPRELRPEISPPTADHVEAVYRLLASDYRLPLLVLDATGMRVGELVALTWGDIDEPRGRWRVSRAVAKTRIGRWVTVPPVLFQAVLDLCPRDDRHVDRRVFESVNDGRLRMAIQRACVAAGIPVFSPHDLRHRRISLAHLAGIPWARIGEQVGQRDLAITANTYTHVLTDEAELDYAKMLASARPEQTPVRTSLLLTR